MEKAIPERGDIYSIQLGPVRGHEINQKERPAVVVSLNDLNTKDLVIVVVPGTSLKKITKPPFKTEAFIHPTSENGLRRATIFQSLQLRAVDKSRLSRSGKGFFRIGKLSSEEMKQVEDSILFTLGLDIRFIEEK